MSRRHKRSAPLPPLRPEPVSTPPPAPARAVVLRWALPLDVSPRQAEHALDLALMHEAAVRWHWCGEVAVVQTARVQAALAMLAPTLGAPLP